MGYTTVDVARSVRGSTCLVFEVAGQRYALPIGDVLEVLPRAALTALPGAPPGLTGILRLRGAILPVVDLRRRLDLPEATPSVGQRIVVTRAGSWAAGLMVDAVQGLETLEALPEAHPGNLVHAVAETRRGVVTVLDAEAAAGAEIARFMATIGTRALTSGQAAAQTRPAAGEPAAQ